MHYQSDITSFSDKIWTRDEIERWLGKRFSGNTILMPTDDFYGKLQTKKELEEFCNELKKIYKIRKNITYSFSPDIKAPGRCSYVDNRLSLILPMYYLGLPLMAAAGCSHLLAHAMLLSEKKIHIDKQEDERLSDLATIYAGLGVVQINGSMRGGLRSYIKQSNSKSAVIGYFNVGQYSARLRHYIHDRDFNLKKATFHTVPWLQRYISSAKPHPAQKLPNFVSSAKKRTLRSLYSVIASATIIIVLIILLLLGTIFSPVNTDKELKLLKSSATELRLAYDGCISRYQKLQEELPADEISSVRLLSYEQNRCKSLENRYNNLSNEYNKRLKNL